jgi:hypothetical protein
MYPKPMTLLLGLAALTMAGCKKPAPAPPAQETAAPAAPLAVASIDLGKAIGPDKRVTTPLTTFGLRDTIYASVNTTGAGTNAPIAAKWTYVGVKEITVNESSESVSPTGPAVTEFHITKATPWPAGKYKVEITLNGAPAGTKEFEIKK